MLYHAAAGPGSEGVCLATLTFIGAAREVTGSCHLLSTESGRILLDCGIRQGPAEAEALNRRPFPFAPATIDAVVLSHAHLDHCGLLPRLVREGFRGPIYATPATRDLLGLQLRDSALLEASDIAWENRQRERAGRPLATPLFTLEDVTATLARVQAVHFGAAVRISSDVEARLHPAGHILGAAVADLRVGQRDQRRLVFSGDLGHGAAVLMPPPAPIDGADLLVLESTYGDRDHRPLDETVEELAQILRAAHRQGGNVLIPSFAIGRTQEILFLLGQLHQEGRVPQRVVFLDSPMAIEATAIHHRHMDLLRPRALDRMAQADAANLHAWLPLLRVSRTTADSMAINRMRGGAIIIAGSGMCTGGRIRHHLKHNLWRQETRVVITGYQARGTPGRALVDGAAHLELFGHDVAIRARVHTLGGFSAHAGQSQLLEWVGGMRSPAPRICLVHGEPEKAEVLAGRIRERFGNPVTIPAAMDTADL